MGVTYGILVDQQLIHFYTFIISSVMQCQHVLYYVLYVLCIFFADVRCSHVQSYQTITMCH